VSEKKPALEEIDGLSSKLRAIFLVLETEIADIEKKFRSAELDFMYGNISENFYSEKMQQLSEDIARLKDKLEKIQDT
jgi:hypothetical protein